MRPEYETPLEVKNPGTGRTLTYEIAGDRSGVPVFLLHGMPGSSSGPRPRNAVLYRLGVRLVSYNRPGYGGSTRWPGRSVADAAADVAFLAEHLGVDKFAIMGRSGGGPHALACAALLPERVLRAAVLVSFAPAEAVDLDWYSNMAGSNVEAYRDAVFDKRRLIDALKVRVDHVQRDPAYLLDLLRNEMTKADARIADDLTLRELLLRTYQNAVADGPYGWIDDVFALRHEWGFRPESITVPVRLWHGADDQFAPASHTNWLAERIPGATVEVQAGASHFGAFSAVPRLLEWLAAGAAGLATKARPSEPVRAPLDSPAPPAAKPVPPRSDWPVPGPGKSERPVPVTIGPERAAHPKPSPVFAVARNASRRRRMAFRH